MTTTQAAPTLLQALVQRDYVALAELVKTNDMNKELNFSTNLKEYNDYLKPIWYALRSDDLDLITFLLPHVDLYKRNHYYHDESYDTICYAIQQNSQHLTLLLQHVEQDERINVPNATYAHVSDIDDSVNAITNMTYLHYACKYDKPDVVKLLLTFGADPTIQTKEGRTAWDLWPDMKPKTDTCTMQ